MVENAELQKHFRSRSIDELRERAQVGAEVVGIPASVRGSWRRYVWENGGGDVAGWFFHPDELRQLCHPTMRKAAADRFGPSWGAFSTFLSTWYENDP